MESEKEPQMICEFTDREVGLKAFLVIDTCPEAGACGGVRARDGVTLEEVTALAKTMTLKYRFVGLPVGGAKAGINMPSNVSPDRRVAMFEAFGRQAAPLLTKEIYHPWSDINTGPSEMNSILSGAGLPPRDWPDSGLYTAMTVVAAVRACCEARSMELDGLTIAIEGFGNVGSHIGSELDRLGARVVAVSTIDGAIHDPAGLDLPSLLDLLRDHGSRFVHSTKAPRITQAELLELPVDVLIPAAGPWTINPDNVGKVQATMIVPAANIPIAPAAAKQLIRKADVLPDFVCNSGGVLGSFLEKKGFDPATVRTKLMEDFRAIVKDLIITGQINNPPYGALKDITWV